MFDLLVGFLLVGTSVAALQLLLDHLLGLRARFLRGGLGQLVRGAGVPKGFRDDRLVDRVLSDPRFDPLSSGARSDRPVARITAVDRREFVEVTREVLEEEGGSERFVEGLERRPESVQEEVRRELTKLPARIRNAFTARFDATMGSLADRREAFLRLLAVLIGAPAGIVFAYFTHGIRMSWIPVALLALFCVPVLAILVSALLRHATRRPVVVARAASEEPRGEKSRGRRNPRNTGGGSPDAKRAPAKAAPAEAGAAGSGGGGSRRRRRSGRRSGGRSGGANGGRGGESGEGSKG
jgi:hypothetical protein